MERTTPDHTPGKATLTLPAKARTAWLGYELPSYRAFQAGEMKATHHVFDLIQSKRPDHTIHIHTEVQLYALLRSVYSRKFTRYNVEAQGEVLKALMPIVATFPMTFDTHRMVKAFIADKGPRLHELRRRLLDKKQAA